MDGIPGGGVVAAMRQLRTLDLSFVVTKISKGTDTPSRREGQDRARLRLGHLTDNYVNCTGNILGQP